jgi:hypothetical protein
VTTTTDQTPVDLDEAQKLCDEATRGPWAWRGYDDGAIELRARLRGGMRVITTIRSEPCVAMTADGALVLLEAACASCRRGYDAADLDEMQRCEKPENRSTIWANSELGVVKPLNEWAVREVPYRADVADVTHPDARFIARSRELLPRVIAELEAAREQRDENLANVRRIDDLRIAETARLGRALEVADELAEFARLVDQDAPEPWRKFSTALDGLRKKASAYEQARAGEGA